ncbi:MAG: UDP-N-acetylmuramate--L-alanine ligase [Candidatus Omnitrophota bacterium]
MKRSIHFIGIGGIGMSGIAKILLKQGNRVSGSDIKKSEITRELSSLGANIFIGHNVANIFDSDLVTYSSAIDSKNPELTQAIKRNIPVVKRAQLLAELMKDKKGITVAGAHGKTTTTSLISFLLDKSDFNPTVVTGGNVFDFDSNALLGEGAYFVAELDESDESFLYFEPFYSVVTNIDFEHVDHYKNWDNILNAFRKFFEQTKKDGMIFACGDDENIKNILRGKERKYISFGLSKDCDIYADEILLEDFSSKFKCVYKDNLMGEITLNIPGRHNISNCLAAIALGLKLGIDFKKIKDCLALYKGVERRFQFKGEISNIKIVDDYGHHPTEIKATLEAARALKPKRLVVAFQPHRYSRTKFLFEEFLKSFDYADSLIITDIYSANEKPIPGVSAKNMYDSLSQQNKKDVNFLSKEKIVQHLVKTSRPGDLIITLGAGDIGDLSDELLQRLKETH